MSLIAIILIGVGFYAGIRLSIPAIRNAQTEFTNETIMMDIHIVSTLGLTDEDVEELKKLDGVDKVTSGYSEFAYDGNDVIRVISIDNEINRSLLKDGTRPVKDDECLADNAHYKVGDVITVREPSGDEAENSVEKEVAESTAGDAEPQTEDTGEDSEEDENSDGILRVHKYKVVGTVVDPTYLGDDYGSATIGNGELTSYILVDKNVFDIDSYTDIYMTMKKTEDDVPYSDSYEKKLENLKSKIETIREKREKAREDDLHERAVQTAYNEVEKRREEIREEVRAKVEEEVRAKVKKEQDKTIAGLKEKAGKLGMKFEDFVGTLSEGLRDYISPYTDIEIDSMVDDQMDEAMATAMDEAKDKAAAEVEIPECKWYVNGRDEDVPTYKTLLDQYNEVEAIADIIPLFFIVVVVLMTSNTMSRMIAEERGEMGTLTSLGYSNIRIIGSYMIYVLLATFIGVFGGYFLGEWLLPDFVFKCFPLYLSGIKYIVDLKMIIGSLVVSFVVMTGVTVYSCMMELRHKPAYLLRPVPPKKGRKLLLERIKGFWGRLSFSWKITIRNLFRYKRRVIMTILGVGGCTFLMLIGFALRDCVSGIGDKQFKDIIHYDVMAVMNEGVAGFDKIDSDGEDLGKLLTDPLMLRQETLTISKGDDFNLDVYLIVPDDDSDKFADYFTLRAADPRDIGFRQDEELKKGTPLTLDNDGVIITPRIAERLHIGIGDKLVLQNSDGESYSVNISAITENYVSNYVYMSEDLYRQTFRHGVLYNTVVAKNALGDSKKLAEKLYDIDTFVNVTTSEKVQRQANEAIKGLDSVVVLLVVIASLLAFTVIYNLIAISISERTREIATLKVLGFTPVETNNYIYRETIISSIAGIIIGLLITPYILGIVLDIIGVDNLIFVRIIKPVSYFMATGLALVFTFVMMGVTFLKLRSIDMIESLKSVD